jgi:hypothetical protein
MFKRWLAIVAAASLPLGGAGCGNAPGHYPVFGKVMHKGDPAAGAVVYFHREGPTASAAQTIPHGIVEEDGSFYVTSDGLGDGCPPGKYAVLVEWRNGSGDGVMPVKTEGKTALVKRSRMRSGPDRLNGRYLDIGKPLLHAEVFPQSNTLPAFELGD